MDDGEKFMRCLALYTIIESFMRNYISADDCIKQCEEAIHGED